MRTAALLVMLSFATPALAGEPVRPEVLAPSSHLRTGEVVGAQMFGMGVASFLGAVAVANWGPPTPQNERLTWGLVAGGLALGGLGYMLFAASR